MSKEDFEITVSCRIPYSLVQLLDTLVGNLDRNRSWLLAKAVKEGIYKESARQSKMNMKKANAIAQRTRRHSKQMQTITDELHADKALIPLNKMEDLKNGDGDGETEEKE